MRISCIGFSKLYFWHQSVYKEKMASMNRIMSKLHHDQHTTVTSLLPNGSDEASSCAPTICRRSSNGSRRTSSVISSTLSYGASLRRSQLLWLILAIMIGFLNQAALSVAQESVDSVAQESVDAVANNSVAVTVYYNPDAPPALNIRECINMFDTLDQTLYICRDNPDMVPMLQYAESYAKKECERQFENEIWNCSEFSLLKTPKINKGSAVYNESAFVDAISVAAIAHTIAKACKEGLLKSCSCADNSTTQSKADENSSVQYTTGCSDNVDYGLTVAETFLNKRHTTVGRDLKHELVQHNYRAAKMAVKEVISETPVTCTCHGVSGSCTLQTCYSDLPEFEVLGKALKEKADSACKVAANGHSNNAWISKCGRQHTNSDFIYRDEANWCVADATIGAPGMIGRTCDQRGTGEAGSCDKLCLGCGLTPQPHEVSYEYQCRCSFHFCCEIHCSTCVGEKIEYTCQLPSS